MYGDKVTGNTACDIQVPPPIEPISSVNQNTLEILQDVNLTLGGLLAKVRGSQPEKTEGNLAKMPERHVLADARALRDLAATILEKSRELHRYIGHDK